MPKSAEAKARAAKALKGKRHRLKAEREAKAQLDAAAEVTCEDCKKLMAALSGRRSHIEDLKRALEERISIQEETKRAFDKAEENFEKERRIFESATTAADNATTELKQSRRDWRVEKAEMEMRHNLEIQKLVQEHREEMRQLREHKEAEEEANIFVDPKDSPSRSPSKKKKKKGKWGGDHRSATFRKSQAEKKKQQQRA